VGREIELSLLELDLVGEALKLDVRQFPFTFPVHGELIEDRARFAEVAHGTLTGKGLIDGPRFASELEQLIGVFSRGVVSIVMLGTAGPRSLLARVSGDGRFVGLAEQRDQIMRFEAVNPENLVRPIVGLLPPLKPAPGRSVTISQAPAAPVGRRHRRDDDEEFFGGGVLEPARPQQDSAAASLARVEEIMQRPRLGSGYFAVTVRARNGREGKPLTVNWLDTDAGRYVAIPSERPDGTLDATYTPGDLQLLDQVLTRHVRTLTQ
jgi:hypothetical protein